MIFVFTGLLMILNCIRIITYIIPPIAFEINGIGNCVWIAWYFQIQSTHDYSLSF